MDSTSFQHEFEAKFRGDREEITGRLVFYLPFLRIFLLEQLRHSHDGHIGQRPRLIDLGCGRGEWLELAGALGFDAHGVDLDESMLQDCRARGLSVRQEDMIRCLEALPDHSQTVVSGFHMAAHLPFDMLQKLVSEALRVLIPGGLLILETPNAENIHVGTLTFHLDPTDHKPLPPGLLSFLPRQHGFYRSKVFRLQENRILAQAPTVSLFDVLTGVSPDYAVIAQKSADNALLQAFDAVFAQETGLTLETLASRFENAFVRKADLAELERQKQPAEPLVTARELEERLQHLRTEMLALASENAARRQQLQDIYASTSWRLTGPLRRLVRLAKRLRSPPPIHAASVETAPEKPREIAPEQTLPADAARIFARLKAKTGHND